MRIDAEIKPVVVEIDEKEYAVAAKTVEVAEKLQKAEEAAIKGQKPQFELWQQHLDILLGRAAVKELFPAGKAENLDRMGAIYYGVMDAFNYNGREAREARAEASVSEAKALADALKPLSDLMAMLNGKDGGASAGAYPTIKRVK